MAGPTGLNHGAKTNILPLVIAVTGHRDLVETQIPAIRQRVRSLFEQLRIDYPHNPLKLLSALAEGADRLVAEVAIELGIELVVPLPKPKEEYLRDFQDTASRQHFSRLCEQATDVFELECSLPSAPQGINPDAWQNDYPYAYLGAYLSSHCHLLLALWDGIDSDQLGGTAQVVKFHHDNVMPGLIPKTVATQQMLVDDESDLVFHIVCARQQNGDPLTKDGVTEEIDWCWFTKDADKPRAKELPAQHKLIFQRCGEFSADIQLLQNKIEKFIQPLFREDLKNNFPAGLNAIDQLYNQADALALHFQHRTLNTLLATHLMAFVMGLTFIFYSDYQTWRLLLIIFVACFGFAAGVHMLARRGGWHRKYLDYRTLAEGLRVQFYWTAAGIRSENKWKFTHDAYLQSQNPEFGWIRNVMRVAGIICDAKPADNEIGLDYVIDEWIGAPDQGQLGYFKRKARERINRQQLTDRLAKLSLMTSVMTVIIFIVFAGRLSESVHQALQIIMGVTLLIYGIREGYNYATATGELIKQYEFMLRIFDNAHRRLQQTAEQDDQRLILKALGYSALDEHADWLLMHRERSLDESEIWRMGS